MNGLFDQPFQQGDTWTFEILDLVDRRGAPVTDLTDWSARFTMRLRPGMPLALYAVGAISTAVNAEDETVPAFKWEIPKTTTAALLAADYVADIELTDPAGRISTINKGIVSVEADNSPFANSALVMQPAQTMSGTGTQTI